MKQKIIDRTNGYINKCADEIQELFPGFPTNVLVSDLMDYNKQREIIKLLPKIILFLAYKKADLGWCTEGKPKKQTLRNIFSEIDKKITECDIISDEVIWGIDKYINGIVTTLVIQELMLEIKLDKQDKIKLDKAYYFFCQEDFYTCSFYLSTLIDTQSIKTELKHFITEGGDTPSQCWKSYIRIVEYYFADIIFNKKQIRSQKLIDGKSRRNEFVKLMDKINYENFTENEDLIISVFSIGYSLLNFFENTNWGEYKNTRPAYFNRNWLTHGMYDIEDVERIDCIKLFFLLYSVNTLFSKINIKEKCL